MTTTFEVRQEGSRNVMLTVPDVKLEAGHPYTIIATSKTAGAPGLEAIKIDDQIGATGTSYTQPSPAATMREK